VHFGNEENDSYKYEIYRAWQNLSEEKYAQSKTIRADKVMTVRNISLMIRGHYDDVLVIAEKRG
jgi:hypothetical protein